MVKFALVGIERGYFLDIQHFFGDRELVGFKVLCSPCNLRCYYCHRIEFLDRDVDRLSTDEVMRAMDEWKPFNIVTMTGGEITMMAEPAAKIMEILRERYQAETVFSTNGTLPRQVERLIPYASVAKIDIKGSRRLYRKITGADCYDRVLESLRICAEHIPTEVKIILHGFTSKRDITEVLGDVEKATGLPDSVIIEFQIVRDFLGKGFVEPGLEQMVEACRKAGPVPKTVLFKHYGEKEVIMKLLGGEWAPYREKEVPLKFNW